MKKSKQSSMKCKHVWDKDIEPWKPRTFIQCVKCGKVLRDFEHYVIMLTEGMEIESVLDVGTGKKGPVAEHYWCTRNILKGYVCDIWAIKENLNPFWIRLKMNALDLMRMLEPDSIDVVQAFGFLEHLEKEDGLKFLDTAEIIARKLVIVSGALSIHGPDAYYKARVDGNPYHVYRSTWSHDEFKKLGWETDWEWFINGESYGKPDAKDYSSGDAIAWKTKK